jgi:hypothetical protein
VRRDYAPLSVGQIGLVSRDGAVMLLSMTLANSINLIVSSPQHSEVTSCRYSSVVEHPILVKVEMALRHTQASSIT